MMGSHVIANIRAQHPRTSSPSTVEDLSVAPDLPPPEPQVGELSGLTEPTDFSAALTRAETADTVKVKNDAQHRNRGALTDLFPGSVEVKTSSEGSDW